VLAYSETVYDLLKLLHILAAIIWVGTGIYFQFQGTRLMKMGDRSRVGSFALDVDQAGKVLLLPASVLVLMTGIAMLLYAPRWSLSDTWILIGLAGAVATAITGSVFIGPTAGKIGKVITAEGTDSPKVQPLVRKIFLVSRVDQVVLLVVIWAMVFKPGS